MGSGVVFSIAVFEGSYFDGSGTEGLLHLLIHGAGVPTVCRVLNITTKFQPVVVGARAGDPLGVVAGFFIDSQCLLAGMSLAL